MTRTARRRWTRELDSEVDGVLFGARGPVVLHGYDPPAGGKWVEDVIPGKLGAFDRQTGERMWLSPCEVGYGRGFGAGFGAEDDLLVLGPGQGGHRIARIALETGELLDIEPLPEFDTAMVGSDVSVVVGPTQLVGVLSPTLQAIWTYRASGMRYHRATRDGERIYCAFSKKGSRNQGLLAVGVEGGEKLGEVLPATQPAIDGLEASEGLLVMLVGDLLASLPEEEQRDYQLKKLLAEDPEDFGGSSSGAAPGLLAMNMTRPKEPRVTWYRELVGAEPGEATIAMDSGKVYEARGTQLAVLDALSGRELGQAMVPGLDEHVAWAVRDGAFLLAEENRVSVYEIPD